MSGAETSAAEVPSPLTLGRQPVYVRIVYNQPVYSAPRAPPSAASMPTRSAIETFLPVKSDAFYVLLVLLHGERHGYAIMREAADRSEGRVEIQAGALYRLLRRMLEDGLIAISDVDIVRLVHGSPKEESDARSNG